MTPTTIITGPQGSGKTKAAIMFTRGEKTVWIPAEMIGSRFAYSSIDDNTKFIVVDDVKSISQVRPLIDSPTLKVERPLMSDLVIKRPHLIICSQKQLLL